MKRYSYAGESRGKTDPDETWHIDVDESCDIDECDGDDCDHVVIAWTGDEYNLAHTWISAEEDSVIDLEKAR